MNLAAATNENLAEISNVLIYSSMAVYTLAFFAHIAEWVLGSRSKVGRTAAALAGSASGTPAAAAAPVVVQGGATTVLERPKVVTRAATGTRDVPDGPGPRAARSRATCGEDRGLDDRDRLRRGGGRCPHPRPVGAAGPWANMYEFSITFSTVAVGSYLVLLALKKNVRWIGLPLVTTVLLDLGLATTVLYTDSDQLVPALHSYWLWIHVSTAILCGAVFYLGAVGTILYLFRDSYENKLASGGTPGKFATSVMERLPSASSLDKFSYRINAAVFPLWTFTIIAGAIWAGDAWGRYWGWDPKEVWSFITWVAYAAYLHARATAGWKGRKAAYLALIAFACWLFNYYGVNIFVSGLHSYAGV